MNKIPTCNSSLMLNTNKTIFILLRYPKVIQLIAYWNFTFRFDEAWVAAGLIEINVAYEEVNAGHDEDGDEEHQMADGEVMGVNDAADDVEYGVQVQGVVEMDHDLIVAGVERK